MPTMSETLRNCMLVGTIVVLMVVLLLVDRKRSSQALANVNERVAAYRIVRLEFVRQMLSSFAASMPPDMRMRMHRRIAEHDEVHDEDSEIRWERVWMPEMRKLMGQLDKSVIGPDRDTLLRTKEAFETNERLLSEALDNRDALAARLSMRIGRKHHISETI